MERRGTVNRKNLIARFTVNLGLLLFCSAMAFSGFLIQFEYHMGHHGEIDTGYRVLGIDYSGWSGIHQASAVVVSILMILHIVLDWKWYETIMRKKHLLAKNKQVITLAAVFALVALTGYVPWLVKMAGGPDPTRKLFIEIHDKLVFVLFVYLILHVIRRFKWFVAAFKGLKR